MPESYSAQRDYMEGVRSDAEIRQGAVETALREAFAPFIEKREVEVIVFSDMSALD